MIEGLLILDDQILISQAR